MSNPLDPAIEAKRQYREGLMKSVRQLDEEIQLLELETRKEERQRLQPLASWLHEMFCAYDHTESCGWCYEVKGSEHEWGGHAHRHWLDVAERLTAGLKNWNNRYHQPPTEEQIILACQTICGKEIRMHYELLERIRHLIK